MNVNDNANHVETLVKRAAEAKTPDDAMKLSQAAFNAANAIAVLNNIKKN